MWCGEREIDPPSRFRELEEGGRKGGWISAGSVLPFLDGREGPPPSPGPTPLPLLFIISSNVDSQNSESDKQTRQRSLTLRANP